MKLILHIGIPKTGTTTLQAACHSAREALLSQHQILYPETGLWLDLSHHTLGFALQGVADYAGHAVPDRQTVLSQLTAEIKAAGNPEYVLISSEIFQALIWKDRIEMLRALTDLFDETYVICFVRRQDVLLESLFKQNVKDPEIRLHQTPSAFMTDRLHWFNYRQLFQEWGHAFGMGNVFPIPYSNRRKERLVETFSATVSRITGSEIVINDAEQKNRSLNGKGLEIKWALNQTVTDRRANDALLEYLFKHVDCTSQRRIFNHQQRLKIQDNYFESNLWMFETFKRKDWKQFQNVKLMGALFKPLDDAEIREVEADFRLIEAG